MTIPIGKDYTFTLQVLAPNSLEPLDVTGYTGTINIFRQDDYTDKPVSNVHIEPIPFEELNGIMTGTIPGSTTAGMSIPEEDKGYAADYSYVRARYAGFIHLSNPGDPTVNVHIPAISFVFAG